MSDLLANTLPGLRPWGMPEGFAHADGPTSSLVQVAYVRSDWLEAMLVSGSEDRA